MVNSLRPRRAMYGDDPVMVSGTPDRAAPPGQQCCVPRAGPTAGRPVPAAPRQPHRHSCGAAARAAAAGWPLKLHRVVPAHSSAVLEAPDLLQAWIRRQGLERGLRALGGNLETPVESRQELFQYGLGLFNGGGSGQPEFRDQPTLEGSRRPFHTPLRPGRPGKYHFSAQLCHGPSELGGRPSRLISRSVPEDRMAVGV